MSHIQVPNSTYALFVSKLREKFGELLLFPETILFDTTYRTVDPDAKGLRKMRDYWEVSFMVSDPERPYMDYYAAGDNSSLHQRMDGMGNIVNLENFEGQFGWPIYDDEIKTREAHEAIKQHNQNVQQILLSKGLLK